MKILCLVFSLLFASNALAGEVKASTRFFCKMPDVLIEIAKAPDDGDELAKTAIVKKKCVYTDHLIPFQGDVIYTLNGLSVLKVDDEELYVIGDAKVKNEI